MAVEVIIPCVNYSDFLHLTLPTTKKWLDRVTVLTSPDDHATTAVAERHGASVCQTEVWHRNGATFAKAAAINDFLQQLPTADTWVLLLDADILLTHDIRSEIDTLDPLSLYSIKRRMCETELEWNGYCDGARDLQDFPIDHVPVVQGRAWGRHPTANTAGLCGYFQLWHLTESAGMKSMPETGNAGGYDILFALSFPQDRRHDLAGHEVLHLGPTRKNWEGRISIPWRSARSHPAAIPN